MAWLPLISYFFGGAFLSNAVPHFVSGMMGRAFQSPFAKPRGEGLSSSTVNVLWGVFNLVVAYVLIERVGDPAGESACEPRGSLWCAAQALDATALLWHRLRPAAGRRFGALGASLQHHVRTARAPAASRSFAAATARSAGAALEQLASRTRPLDDALEEFEGATVALGCMGVRLWAERCRPSHPGGSAVNRAVAVRRHAAEVAVVAAGLVILLTGWLWLDPLVSLAVNAVIVWGTWGLLRDALGMSVAAVPRGLDASAVRAFLSTHPAVASLHDLHIWAIGTTDIALTCHLVTPQGHPGDAVLHELAAELAKRFRINHATMQIETDAQGVCALAPDHVV